MIIMVINYIIKNYILVLLIKTNEIRENKDIIFWKKLQISLKFFDNNFTDFLKT